MASFPSLSSGTFTFQHPLERTNKFRTRVHRSVDFSEQRYIQGTQLAEFSLQYTNLITADKELLRAFFTTTLGETDTTWDITVDGVLYDHMQFLGPTFEATEKSEGLWSVDLKCCQTRPN